MISSVFAKSFVEEMSMIGALEVTSGVRNVMNDFR